MMNDEFVKFIIHHSSFNHKLLVMNKLIKRNILYYFLMVTAFEPMAQTQPLTTILENGDMVIGDQNKITFELSAKSGLQPQNVDPIVPDSVQGFELLEKGKWALVKDTWTRDVLFTAWDSGAYYIPTFQFAVTLAGKSDTLSTDRLPFRVVYPKLKNEEIAPIKEIFRTDFSFEDAIPYLIALITVVLLGLILFLWREKWRKKPPPMIISKQIVVSPYEEARNQLMALRAKALWQQGEIKPYHTELTHILRDYLEKRYQILALESTSDELIAALRQTDMPLAIQFKFKKLLQMADLVKFAKVVPELDVHDEAYATAMELVMETEPITKSNDTNLSN
jgi:hypothetical protein